MLNHQPAEPPGRHTPRSIAGQPVTLAKAASHKVAELRRLMYNPLLGLSAVAGCRPYLLCPSTQLGAQCDSTRHLLHGSARQAPDRGQALLPRRLTAPLPGTTRRAPPPLSRPASAAGDVPAGATPRSPVTGAAWRSPSAGRPPRVLEVHPSTWFLPLPSRRLPSRGRYTSSALTIRSRHLKADRPVGM